ncbi:hypothetical protein GW579_00805 [Rahnella sp. Lac-M11]|uniref:Uncharacterized protein n=1 Tax=Rahnella contaminans TaxID=2703882 RepID=A0A6M2AYP4_9GAMM|nr:MULTISPECIES: hypothetical protein [Rahnella]KAB8308746.1 hypothetical protein EH227_12445 [Rouxiella chamberiensis]MBU9819430.1 hypothetical protein [Rahnella sp. BCC 1045]MCS3421685.1 formiminotetrahydrofolate cyclodeaminase [Rahnella sp. BIGb0603]MDF1893636.1 hypothetical protein [Rahnella contaminans]NGX85623.1 hypothetical protein [Rahnella contaminans]
MSDSHENPDVLLRTAQALEAAIAFSIASISVNLPDVKTEVVESLRRNTANSDKQDPTKDAIEHLVTLIETAAGSSEKHRV